MTNPTTRDWAPCPAGELQRLMGHLAFRRRLRTIAVAAALVLLTAAVLAGGWGIYCAASASPANQPEPILCIDEC